MSKKDIFKQAKHSHKVWHKFYNWMVKTYGKGLHGKQQVVKDKKGKVIYRYRSFNELELSRRLVGYEVMCRVKKYINRCCPEIKVIPCDDSSYSGSDILLIPHPKHGITVMFIPQCTTVQNQFFLYKNHYSFLMKELVKMKSVYPKNEE